MMMFAVVLSHDLLFICVVSLSKPLSRYYFYYDYLGLLLYYHYFYYLLILFYYIFLANPGQSTFLNRESTVKIRCLVRMCYPIHIPITIDNNVTTVAVKGC